MKREWFVAATGAAVLGIVIAAVLWMQSRSPAPGAPEAAPSAARVPSASSAPAAASEPAVRYPVEPATAERSGAPLDVGSALDDLFGSRTVKSTFQVDDFARRFVATVDNLGRSTASPRLWPVNPAPGRFAVDPADGGGDVIGAANAARYTPFVTLIEGVDLHRAVAAYARLYPLFQHAYEDLGYPKRYFNDRLVEVVDRLLVTPEPSSPPNVHLPSINGPAQPERPWVLYEFDDPALQSLTAGQKILVRMGVENERRVKARLVDLRGLITSTKTLR
ncbi:MAG TPA: DUF3014 domain-containing protein [Caldimonas sp.]